MNEKQAIALSRYSRQKYAICPFCGTVTEFSVTDYVSNAKMIDAPVGVRIRAFNNYPSYVVDCSCGEYLTEDDGNIIDKDFAMYIKRMMDIGFKFNSGCSLDFISSMTKDDNHNDSYSDVTEHITANVDDVIFSKVPAWFNHSVYESMSNKLGDDWIVEWSYNTVNVLMISRNNSYDHDTIDMMEHGAMSYSIGVSLINNARVDQILLLSRWVTELEKLSMSHVKECKGCELHCDDDADCPYLLSRSDDADFCNNHPEKTSCDGCNLHCPEINDNHKKNDVHDKINELNSKLDHVLTNIDASDDTDLIKMYLTKYKVDEDLDDGMDTPLDEDLYALANVLVPMSVAGVMNNLDDAQKDWIVFKAVCVYNGDIAAALRHFKFELK